jgi:hypothetical protein
MSMATIGIEQIERDKWLAEVEVGGLVARRMVVRAETFDGIVAEVQRVYREIMPAFGPSAAEMEARAAAALQQRVALAQQERLDRVRIAEAAEHERVAAEAKAQGARDRMAKARAARKPRDAA